MYVKKPAELKTIRAGGKLMGEILEKLAGFVKPGVSAWELDQEAERMILDAGGAPAFKGYRGRPNDPPFPSTICVSVNEEVVHGMATKDKIIRSGDVFSIDIGMQWPASKGYFVDTAITMAVGKVSKATQQLIDVTQEALKVGIEAIRNGKTIADIGRAVQQYIQPYGYGIVRDLVGHGVGHAVHEEPRVPNYYDKELEQWSLQPGVVIAIEPMITLGDYHVKTADDGWTIVTTDGSLSAHFEHTVIITKDGPEVVTRRPSEAE
jgi:methionyl aminopeptidase